MDIYEKYFESNDHEYCSEPPSAKGLAVFRDPSPVKRNATTINWHPEINSSKIAVSYSILNFQDDRLDDPQLPTSVRVNARVSYFYLTYLYLNNHDNPYTLTSHISGI